jgi:hypothetical protein
MEILVVELEISVEHIGGFLSVGKADFGKNPVEVTRRFLKRTGLTGNQTNRGDQQRYGDE